MHTWFSRILTVAVLGASLIGLSACADTTDVEVPPPAPAVEEEASDPAESDGSDSAPDSTGEMATPDEEAPEVLEEEPLDEEPMDVESE